MIPRVICIIGPDGTGKTTQVKMLIKYLKENGYNYEYRWMRFHHFISLPVLALARILGLTEIQQLPNGKKIGYHHFYKSKLISNLYMISLYLDTLLAMVFKIYIPIKIRKKYIICDRFIYDTLVDLIVDLDNFEILDSMLGRLFLKLIPKDCLVIMLLAPYEKIRDRRVDLKYDKSLEKRMGIYNKIAEKFKIKKVDASLGIKSVHKEILSILRGI
jgi:thymidylate kinase